jgi:hypothetical protein
MPIELKLGCIDEEGAWEFLDHAVGAGLHVFGSNTQALRLRSHFAHPFRHQG